jgi:hypothetical protein
LLVALDVTLQGIQLGRQAREISGNVLDILIGQRGIHTLHDRVVTLTVLVLVQHLHQVGVVLAGETRVLRIDRIAIGTMAGKAGAAFCLPFSALPLASTWAEANASMAPNENRVSARFMRRVLGNYLARLER